MQRVRARYLKLNGSSMKTQGELLRLPFLFLLLLIALVVRLIGRIDGVMAIRKHPLSESTWAA